jgi:hypothetical protein
MLVHHVNHSVAESPEEKKRADDDEREHHVFPVAGYEHALIVCAHGVFENNADNSNVCRYSEVSRRCCEPGSRIHGQLIADILAIKGTARPRQVFRFKPQRYRCRQTPPAVPEIIHFRDNKIHNRGLYCRSVFVSLRGS